MTLVLSRLMTFVGRHWLRLLIVGAALFLLSDKQVDLNLRLGTPPGATPVPAAAPVPEPVADPDRPALLSEEPPVPPAAATEEKAGFLDRFSLFGGSSEPSAYDMLARQDEAKIAAFVRRFSNVAQAEQEKFGIPASITLANAMLHGRVGLAPAARDHQNFFGLRCDADWHGASARVAGTCVRAYENAWTSFRDHSLYITSGRFQPMTQFAETDYRRWAAGLEELGYAGTDDLAEQLLRTIDRYQLFRFD